MVEQIHWPKGFGPTEAPIHVVNRIETGTAPEIVWRRLVHAAGWPAIYANASDVAIEGDGADLFAGARFTWKTFGVALKSEVKEFEPETCIAWLAKGIGVTAYHAWLIVPAASGCSILTEETQYGPVSRVGRLLFPTRMERWHQKWLEALAA
ncbi:hypothetical protein NDN01_19950 [Sphingomonas sp. QA11]|uniref:SRPBCC family protein n=1 Tax=Sphingomonas sp. QA11 TaxID=2950605 RepID=UPI00234BAFC5|nr:SRPBCC family protein [Sphingomonas sp. QA11]WCM26256.1 hypothetical protein NDN01_19950 [Sphingomonas sp. QA11]